MGVAQMFYPHALAPGAGDLHENPRIEFSGALPEAANRPLAAIQGFLVCSSTMMRGFIANGRCRPVALCFIRLHVVTVTQRQMLIFNST